MRWSFGRNSQGAVGRSVVAERTDPAPGANHHWLPRLRRLSILVGVGLAGLMAMLAGLVWDAAAHARDTTLAHRESVLSLSSPAHALLFLGAGAVLASLVGAGWEAIGLSRVGRAGAGRPRAAFAAVTALTLSATGAGLIWASELEAGHLSALGSGPVTAADHVASNQVAADPATATPAAAAAHEHGPGIADSHGSGECVPTPEEQKAAQKLIEETIAGVSRLTSLEAALADGYVTASVPPLPTEHYTNGRYTADGKVLDPNHPESLVYTITDRGPVLSGVMYLTNVPGEFGPEVGGCLTQWHVHANLCFSDTTGQLVGETSAEGTCAPGSIRLVPPPALHVWLVDVPGGPFAVNVDHATLLERLGT